MTRKERLTRKFLSLESLEDRLCLSSLPAGTPTTPPDAATQAHLTATYGQLPLSFEANKGQTDARVNFLARGAGYSAFLTPTSAVMELQQGDGGNVVAMKLVGASPTTHPIGLDKTAGVSNYLIGNDPSKWHTNIANYAKVEYQDVYRGINLVYHGDQQQLEYDFVVQPGADPHAIHLAFAGAQGKSIDAQGNLVLHTSGGDLVEHAPVAYQMIDGVQHPISSRFVIGRDGQVGFQVGRYDHTRSLVIDPVLSLSYSTYLGGNGFGDAIAVDSAGNAYITGAANSGTFPVTNGAFQTKFVGQRDAFVLKVNPNLSGSASLVYATYLGGRGQNEGLGIAVDASGDAYLTGYTDSTKFPTMNAFQSASGGGYDAFLTKLNPSGSQLVYSTFLGGSGDEKGEGIAVDGTGKAYVTGYTGSTAFPTTAGAYITSGTGAFAAKLDPSASGPSSLVYSTLLGGNDEIEMDDDYHSDSIAVDGAGNAVVAGDTYSASFPTTAGAYQVTGIGADAFIVKLNSTGAGVVFSTYLGGSYDTRASGVALDTAGNVYTTGMTASQNFPTTSGAFQPQSYDVGNNKDDSGSDAFVTELSADGSRLLYSTYFGGEGYEDVQGVDGVFDPPIGGIAVDASGMIYVTGNAGGYDFPKKFPFQTHDNVEAPQAFVAKFDPTQAGNNSLVYSTILGNTNPNDRTQGGGFGIAAYTDSSGNTFAYVTGFTTATKIPTTPNAFNQNGGHFANNAFFTKLAFN